VIEVFTRRGTSYPAQFSYRIWFQQHVYPRSQKTCSDCNEIYVIIQSLLQTSQNNCIFQPSEMKQSCHDTLRMRRPAPDQRGVLRNPEFPTRTSSAFLSSTNVCYNLKLADLRYSHAGTQGTEQNRTTSSSTASSSAASSSTASSSAASFTAANPS
jgi:hypothetical protein